MMRGAGLSSKTLQTLRQAWPIYASTILIVLLRSTLPRYRQLGLLAPTTSATGQLTSQDATGLAQIGLSLPAYAAYFAVLECLSALFFLLIAAVIYRLRAEEWMPLLFAFGLTGFGLINSPFVTGLEETQPRWASLLVVLRSVALLGFVLAFLLFPDGRFAPPWTKWLAVLWTLYVLLALALPALRLQSSLVWNSYRQVAVLVWVLAWLVLIAVLQVMRYRHDATPRQRDQTKWVVWSLAMGMGASLAAALPVLIMPALNTPPALLMGARMVAFTVVLVATIGMAGAFAFAILSSRLWDIDAVIHRTLVYASLTTLLVMIYLASVILLQTGLSLITGQQTQLSIVLSTLLISALFYPLRLRIQQVIDRRFYRSKHDARQSLDRFALTARNEADLVKLTDEIVRVVQESLQPASVDIWLGDVAGRADRPREG